MWAYFLRRHHSTHYRFCWFWREWGQGEHRQQVCLELEGKPESHLSAESKDLVILSSQMQHPTHILRGGMEDVGGVYHSIPVTQPRPFWNQLLQWAYCVRQELSMSRGHQSLPGGGERALPRPMGRRQKRTNLQWPQLPRAPLAALKGT